MAKQKRILVKNTIHSVFEEERKADFKKAMDTLLDVGKWEGKLKVSYDSLNKKPLLNLPKKDVVNALTPAVKLLEKLNQVYAHTIGDIIRTSILDELFRKFDDKQIIILLTLAKYPKNNKKQIREITKKFGLSNPREFTESFKLLERSKYITYTHPIEKSSRSGPKNVYYLTPTLQEEYSKIFESLIPESVIVDANKENEYKAYVMVENFKKDMRDIDVSCVLTALYDRMESMQNKKMIKPLS
jgi:hypothetical protein